MSKKAGGLNFNPLLSRTEPEQPGSPEAPENTRTPVDTRTREHVPATAGPSKFTFYFNEEQLRRLDDAWATFRRQTRGSGQRLTKSQFVRVALDRLLDDFERDPEEVIALLRNQDGR